MGEWVVEEKRKKQRKVARRVVWCGDVVSGGSRDGVKMCIGCLPYAAWLAGR